MFFYRASFGLRSLLSLHTFFNFMNEKVIFPPFPIHLIFVASGVLIMCDMSLLIVASAYPKFCRVIFYINFNICICFQCLILTIKLVYQEMQADLEVLFSAIKRNTGLRSEQFDSRVPLSEFHCGLISFHYQVLVAHLVCFLK